MADKGRAHYFCTSLYELDQTAQAEIIKTILQRAHPLTQCHYDAQQNTFHLECTVDAGPDSETLLSDTLRRYLALAVRNESDYIKRFHSSLVSFNQQVQDTTPINAQNSNNNAPTTTTTTAFLINTEDAQIKSGVFKLANLPNRIIRRHLTARSAQNCFIIRAMNAESKFDSSLGRPIQYEHDATILEQASFEPFNVTRHSPEPQQVPTVRKWEFVDQNYSMKQWLGWHGETRIVNNKETEDDHVDREPVKAFAESSKQSTVGGRRAHHPARSLPRPLDEASDASSSTSSSDDGSLDGSDFWRLVNAKPGDKSLPGQQPKQHPSVKSEPSAQSKIQRGEKNSDSMTSAMKMCEPKVPEPCVKVPLEVAGSGTGSLQILDKQKPHIGGKSLQNNNERPSPSFGGMYASVDTFGLSGNARNQALWEHSDAASLAACHTRSVVGSRSTDLHRPAWERKMVADKPNNDVTNLGLAMPPTRKDADFPPLPNRTKMAEPANVDKQSPLGDLIDFEDRKQECGRSTAGLRPVSENKPSGSIMDLDIDEQDNKRISQRVPVRDLIDLENDELEHGQSLVCLQPVRETELPPAGSDTIMDFNVDEQDNKLISERYRPISPSDEYRKHDTMRQQAGKKRSRKRKGKLPPQALNQPSVTHTTEESPEHTHSSTTQATTDDTDRTQLPRSHATAEGPEHTQNRPPDAPEQPIESETPTLSEHQQKAAGIIESCLSANDHPPTRVIVRFGTILVEKHTLNPKPYPQKQIEKILATAPHPVVWLSERLTSQTADAMFLLTLAPGIGSEIHASVQYDINLTDASQKTMVLEINPKTFPQCQLIEEPVPAANIHTFNVARMFDTTLVLDGGLAPRNTDFLQEFITSLSGNGEEISATKVPTALQVKSVIAKRMFRKGILYVVECQDLLLERSGTSFTAKWQEQASMIASHRLWWEAYLMEDGLKNPDKLKKAGLQLMAEAQDMVKDMDGVGFYNKGLLNRFKPEKKRVPELPKFW